MGGSSIQLAVGLFHHAYLMNIPVRFCQATIDEKYIELLGM